MTPRDRLSKLTVYEKLRLLNGVGDWHTYDANRKLPTIMMTDGPHGIRKIEDEQTGDITGSKPATCFPTASAIASSWNPEVAARMARHIAAEALQEDISIVLGCGMNIKRNPLCGRNFEYFSEDPFLTAQMAIAYVNAMQDCGVGTCVKHFAANSQETRRMTANSEVDERALRELYLYAFEQVVKQANPTSIMASYNKVNGEYACANAHLLQDILRDEWGYDGLVISDWGACIDAEKCFTSGLNLEMPDNRGYHYKMLCKAYEEGRLSEEQIDALALKIITVVDELRQSTDAAKDELDPCTHCTIPEKECMEDGVGCLAFFEDSFQSRHGVDYLVGMMESRVYFKSQHLAVREIENECAILLQNDHDFLPIGTDEEIIVIGELAEKTRFQGGGSSHINVDVYTNGISGLSAAGYKLQYLKGYGVDTDQPDEALEKETLDALEERIHLGENRPKILFFLGLTDIFEGEGYDRTTLDIPENQRRLLEKVSKLYGEDYIAAITFGGAPMDFSSWKDHVSSILHMHLGGQAVGDSIADLVSGKANPSGRLAETIPGDLERVPSQAFFAPSHDDVEYRESLFVGYRFYETYKVPMTYEFGYGLSYTDFAYLSMELPETFDAMASADDLGNEPSFEVKVTVKNTGEVAGAEVVQIYICPPGADPEMHVYQGEIAGDFLRSSIELKGFQKVFLAPGETKEVIIPLDASAFSVYDVKKGRWTPIEGNYTVAAGMSVENLIHRKTIQVKGEKYSRNERVLVPEYFENHIDGMKRISKESFAKLYGQPLSDYKETKRGDYTIQSSFGDVSKQSLFGRIVRIAVRIGMKFMFPDKKKDSPEMKMVLSGIEEGALEGLIANSGGIVSIKLVDLLVLNANKQYGKAFLRMFKRG
ncbi:MAG: glycoside hydrolase family 3 C-terminal domain-containing protein [Lachnospiraceae bacterium]|nr:glycoside hydrolase family 3 C-terminal domain-containing protein [Lachnospiraceae bacterium]MCQ2522679.1 glycoside hydrolase family 3 C-terminal domain-containing protein [Lachnospiraceae bacterium]